MLNLDEALVEVGDTFDIVFWPAVMDAKYADVEAMADGSIDLTLFCGGIRNDENEHLAHLLRAKSRILVAFGSCASEGCIPGLANLSTVTQIFDASYANATTENPDGLRPAALEGRAVLPPTGTVLGGGHSTVCDECTRERNVKRIARFARITEIASIDPALCLLEQGIPCNGPATRDGCGALCPAASAPCIGCYGAADGVLDYGARLLSAFASVVDASEPAEIETILDGLADPVGQFYRFSLAGSLLRGSRAATQATVGGHHDGAPSPGGPAPAIAASMPPAEPALATAGGPHR